MPAWARATGLALTVLALLAAPLASAQSQASLAVALEAQYRAAIVRERRLADERELRLIADAEMRMREARRVLASVQGDRAAAEAALETARAEYVRLVNEVELLDATARIEVEAFRAELENRLPEATPELLAAYREFADGDRASAWATLEPLLLSRANARVAAARSVAAGEVRQLAQLREVMRVNGEATVADVLALWDQAAELDPNDFWTHATRVRLARQLGDLAREERASAQELSAATSERERAVALVHRADRLFVQGDLSGARAGYEMALAIHSIGPPTGIIDILGLNLDLAATQMALGDVQRAQEDFDAARISYEEGLRRSRYAAGFGGDPAHRSLHLALEKMGKLHLDLRDYGGAQNHYEECLVHARSFAAAHSNDVETRQTFVGCLQGLGEALAGEGNRAASRAAYIESLAIARELVRLDPSSALSEDYVRVSLVGLLENQIADGDLAGAQRSDEEQLRISRNGARETSNAEAQRQLWVSLRFHARALRAADDWAGVLAAHTEGLAIARRLVALDPENARAHRFVWRSMQSLAPFGDSGVTWADVVSTMEALDARGLLHARDRGSLEAARQQAADDAAFAAAQERTNEQVRRYLESGRPAQ